MVRCACAGARIPAVRAGACWIFDIEIDWADDVCRDGDVVDVLDSRNALPRARLLQRQIPHCPARAHVATGPRRRSTGSFSAAASNARGSSAGRLGFSDSCRVVFGEADDLPGLTVDKFADCLSFQTVSARHGAADGRDSWRS
jgi:23S rRNA (cytosine1962-C5)-methyltransferase